jgi:cytochrome b561
MRAKMPTVKKGERFTKYLPGILAIAIAVWLVFPLIRLDQSDYARAKILVYRLALGITILILILGKMGFDLFFPQGIAQKVSNLKSIAFIIFGILILAFVVFIIFKAGSLFISSYPQTTDYTL